MHEAALEKCFFFGKKSKPFLKESTTNRSMRSQGYTRPKLEEYTWCFLEPFQAIGKRQQIHWTSERLGMNREAFVFFASTTHPGQDPYSHSECQIRILLVGA